MMKTINKYFICTENSIYTVVNETLCNVHKGQVRTRLPNAIIFAVGDHTEAHADHLNCHVHAANSTAHAYANSPYSDSYSLVKGSNAHATVLGSTAHATCLNSIVTCKNGAIAIEYNQIKGLK